MYITSECFDDKHVERKTNFQNEYCLIDTIGPAFSKYITDFRIFKHLFYVFAFADTV